MNVEYDFGGVFSARVKLIKPEPEIHAHALHALQFRGLAQCERELAKHGLVPAAA